MQDFTGALVILLMAGVAGLLLIAPLLWWVRRSRRVGGRAAHSRVITRTGFVFYGLMVAVLLTIFAAPYWWPGSVIARISATGWGRCVACLVLIGIFSPIEYALARAGHPCLRPPHRDIDTARDFRLRRQRPKA